MRLPLAPLRALVRDLRLTPEERLDTRTEHCLEALYDPERCACAHSGELGEREEATLEAERRRWVGARPAH